MSEKVINTPEQLSITVSSNGSLLYHYSAGQYGSRFLQALKDQKILASRCGSASGGCGLVLVPPRIVCARCFKKMEEFVELPPTGVLTSYTQVTFPFIDPFTGEKRPIPYCYGMIRFDGADNTFQYFLEETDIRKIRIGMRLRAVFKVRREGSIRDILYFKTEKGKQPPKPIKRSKREQIS